MYGTFDTPPATNDVVCFDLDSTLRNTSQRHHLLPRARPAEYARNPTKVWQDYSRAAANDTPMPGGTTLYKLLAAARCHDGHGRLYRMHICTGADEAGKLITVPWLADHGLRYDELKMRNMQDRSEDDGSRAWLKIIYTRGLRIAGLNPVLWVDDWPADAEAIYRDTGVPVLCADPLYPLAEDPRRWPAKMQVAYARGYAAAEAGVKPEVPGEAFADVAFSRSAPKFTLTDNGVRFE